MKINLRKQAFGLAELIITFLILGIIASLVMPPITKNIQKFILALQLKRAYIRTNEAFALAMAREGANDIKKTSIIKSIKGIDTSRTGQNDFADAITKYFKVERVYKYAELEKPIKPKFLNNKGFSTVNSNAFTMFLQDGTMLKLELKRYGYTHCPRSRIKKLGGKLFEKYGAIYIDVNGEKPPNVVGLDYFYFYLGQDGKLYPNNGIDETINYTCLPYKDNFNYWTNYLVCRNNNSYGYGCAARIMEENWRITY